MLSHLCFQVLTTTFSCFAWRIWRTCCNIFVVFVFTALKKKIVLFIYFCIDLLLLWAKVLNITESVSWLPNQLKKHFQSKRQPLRGEIFKIFGKGGEPYMGRLSILWVAWKFLRNHVPLSVFNKQHSSTWKTKVTLWKTKIK